MENPYYTHYVNQAGTGYAGSVYTGHRYQNGNGFGFFGKILKHLKPALKYIGREGLKTAASIGRDVLNGDNFVEAAKANLVNTGKNILRRAIDKSDEYVSQNGRGVKRRKKAYKSKKDTRKTIKRAKLKKKAKQNKKTEAIGFF